MSLVAFATRICLVYALRGATYAADGVEDSPIDPVALAVAAATPTVAIFTDTETTSVDGGRSLLSGTRSMDIVSHVFLPPTLRFVVDGKTLNFSGRRAGAALVIDLMYRDMTRALMAGDGAWAKLWRRFVPKITQIDHRAYVLQADKQGGGVRIPAREIVMRCETVGEPRIGAEPSGIWADFLAALLTDPATLGLEPLVRQAITGPVLAPDWMVDRWYMGETDEETFALGLGPLDGAPTFADSPPALRPAPMVEVVIDRGGVDDLTVGTSYTLLGGDPQRMVF